MRQRCCNIFLYLTCFCIIQWKENRKNLFQYIFFKSILLTTDCHPFPLYSESQIHAIYVMQCRTGLLVKLLGSLLLISRLKYFIFEKSYNGYLTIQNLIYHNKTFTKVQKKKKEEVTNIYSWLVTVTLYRIILTHSSVYAMNHLSHLHSAICIFDRLSST